MTSFSIRAFVGPNGGGKTLAAVEMFVLDAWAKGRPVVSNMALYPERLGFDAGLARPLGSWTEIPDLRNEDLLLDEISSALPSRQAQSVPPQLVRVLNQLRKGSVRCAWTAPAWARSDLLLREVTQAVTLCHGYLPDRWVRSSDQPKMFPPAALDEDGKRIEADEGWRPNRLFEWRTYDATSFDEFTLSGANKLRSVSRRRYWRSSHRAMLAYSTLEAVDLLDHLDDVGACAVCGGHRARPKCSCDRSPAQRPEAAERANPLHLARASVNGAAR